MNQRFNMIGNEQNTKTNNLEEMLKDPKIRRNITWMMASLTNSSQSFNNIVNHSYNDIKNRITISYG